MYILLSDGISFALLGEVHWIVDVRGWTKWAFPLDLNVELSGEFAVGGEDHHGFASRTDIWHLCANQFFDKFGGAFNRKLA